VISKVEHTDFFTSTRTTKQKYFIIFIKEINKPSYLLAANESTNEWVNRGNALVKAPKQRNHDPIDFNDTKRIIFIKYRKSEQNPGKNK
jgi:hypothetical protein